MLIGLYESSSLKYCKTLIGRTNHNLLTILVSIDTTESLDESQILIKPYARKHWRPDYTTFKSFPNSKTFISNATLAWAIDSLDSYYRLINTTPKLITNNTLSDKLSGSQGEGKSIAHFHSIITREFSSLSPFDCNVITLAIKWRNNLIHHASENKIMDPLKLNLLDIYSNSDKYYNLDISRMITNVENSISPSYTELNAIIRTIIHYIESLDSQLINQLDVEEYIKSVLKKHFTCYISPSRLANYHKKRIERKINILKSILLSNGFTDTHFTIVVPNNLIESLAALKPKEFCAILSNCS
jgi:hypothetical protein